METRNLVCVNCPKGCHIQVSLQDGMIQDIKGYSCENGKKYAQDEVTCPMRTLTTTIKIEGASYPVLPVMTDSPIPLDRMDEAMESIKKISVKAPVKMDEIIVTHFLGTNANLIASRSMK
jgi:CxxC motif-containing protein